MFLFLGFFCFENTAFKTSFFPPSSFWRKNFPGIILRLHSQEELCVGFVRISSEFKMDKKHKVAPTKSKVGKTDLSCWWVFIPECVWSCSSSKRDPRKTFCLREATRLQEEENASVGEEL